jgi:D-alanine--poly(phosphoribitol) ligase subunit 2
MSNTATAVTHFIVEEFAPDLDADNLGPDYDLLEGGIIDSLGLLVVLAWIEEQFDIVVDAGEIDENDFRNVHAICALIESSAQATTSEPGWPAERADAPTTGKG